MFSFLDVLLTFLHLMIIGFNIVGWIWKKTRKLHLIVVIGTALSWFALGIWYGWGYCFLTDWHWQVKRKLGETDLPNSFTEYFANNMLSLNAPSDLVDTVTLWVFVVVIAITLWIHVGRRFLK